jgi:hypothetical protein
MFLPLLDSRQIALCAALLCRSCFCDWWCWQQQALCEQQKQLEQRTGATAAAALMQVGFDLLLVPVKEVCAQSHK